jgi:hypothetical protein
MGEELAAQEAEIVQAPPASPARRESGELQPWQLDARAAALVAAGGAVAGAATVAAVRAARGSRRMPRRWRGRRKESVIASRSFLVDVHVLGR